MALLIKVLSFLGFSNQNLEILVGKMFELRYGKKTRRYLNEAFVMAGNHLKMEAHPLSFNFRYHSLKRGYPRRMTLLVWVRLALAENDSVIQGDSVRANDRNSDSLSLLQHAVTFDGQLMNHLKAIGADGGILIMGWTT